MFLFVVVSNLEKINSITGILKLQTETKNRLLRLKTLHKIQEPSVTSFVRLSRQESVNNFNQTQKQIVALYDIINQQLDSTLYLSTTLVSKKMMPPDSLALNPLKSIMEAIQTYNNVYVTMFDSIVQSKINNNVPERKSRVWIEILEEQGTIISTIIDSAEIVVDNQTNQRIKEVEQEVHNVREITIYIIIGVTFLSLIFALGFSTTFTNSLRRLTVSAGNIGKGDFDVDPHGYPKDEIGDLASAFFQMSVDLKNAQEALIRSKRLAAIGEIVASVNHEINNPLMIISGNAQFLQMTMGNAPPETRERVQTILEETERISKVTRKLREIKNPVIEDYTSTGEQMINLDKSST